MSLSTVLLIAGPALAQAADIITTRIGISKGLEEKNFLIKELVKRPKLFIVVKSLVGIGLSYYTFVTLNAAFASGLIFSLGATFAGLLPAVQNIIQISRIKS
jgi:hypothetical protein